MSRAKTGDLFLRLTDLRQLDLAWEKVRANNGCAGGDGESIPGFQHRAARRIMALSSALRTGRYRPRDLRLVEIAKPSGGTRPLAIPSVEDRIAQTACAQVLTPILDPLFDEGSFGYRPGRSVAQAVRRVGQLRKRGHTHVVEADIVRCFERIPHAPVLDRLEAALADRAGATRVVDLVAHWLEHAAMALGTPGTGLAQGSPVSPLLANLYLDRLDDALDARGVAIVRFADDFVLLCKSEALARKALAEAGDVLGMHGLELKPGKTRIVDFDRGFDFLGHVFVRSMTLRRVADPDEDPVETMRALAVTDARAEARDAKADAAEALERSAGFDPGQRVLHIATPDRRLALRNLSFVVENAEGRELIGLSPGRVDRIELGQGVRVDSDVLRHALATGIDIAFLNGSGETEGWLTPPDYGDAALHLAQSRLVLTPDHATALARALVDGRLRAQRAKLHLLNRDAHDPEVIVATKALGRMIRKLPGAADIAALRGHEGAAGAVYWPALGRLCADAPQPLRRSRPGIDPLNVAINYLTALLERDMRRAAVNVGLHPGIGVLHVATDGHAACVWDLMESFRAPMTEGVPVTLFNQGRLKAEMFVAEPDGTMRILPKGRRALVSGYESAAARPTLSSHCGKRRTWRRIMEEEARAYAAHCRAPESTDFTPFVQGY